MIRRLSICVSRPPYERRAIAVGAAFAVAMLAPSSTVVAQSSEIERNSDLPLGTLTGETLQRAVSNHIFVLRNNAGVKNAVFLPDGRFVLVMEYGTSGTWQIIGDVIIVKLTDSPATIVFRIRSLDSGLRVEQFFSGLTTVYSATRAFRGTIR